MLAEDRDKHSDCRGSCYHCLRDYTNQASPSLLDAHMSVSVRALLYLAQAAHGHLAARRGAFVVLTSPAGSVTFVARFRAS